MDRCRHVNRVTPAADHSILNPQKWLCSFCGTTESVWACLSCSNVACGRYNEEHALRHYNESKHPLAIEVNDKYVFCYVCDEYILNDNAAGDIKILRSALSAIATHTFSDFESRGRRVLRSLSFPGYEKKWQDERKLQNQDRQFTALKFRRYYLLARMFGTWRKQTKTLQKPPTLSPSPSPTPGKRSLTPSQLRKAPSMPLAATLRKRPVIPGVTGLRNLGNTCYMNSVLQVLRSFLANFSHLQEFNEYFLSMKNTEPEKKEGPVPETPVAATAAATVTPERMETRQSQQMLLRQSTIDCFKHISAGRPTPKKGGLNGGGSLPSTAHRKQLNAKNSKDMAKDNNTYTLCEELHALFRVMWSGKWAVVSPHKMLYAVWNIIPFFKGYTQQDAQEFLCEFIDKVQVELTKGVPGAPSSPPYNNCPSPAATASPDAAATPGPSGASPGPSTSSPGPSCSGLNQVNFISDLFQGQLVSEVRCRRCSHRSQTFEPFMDLSLEFPDRYQATGKSKNGSCHLEEMLRKFTDTEKLDGQIYACEECNKRRRSVAARPTVRTEAEKQLLIKRLPTVLRLHLKRFMWSGRNHRGKLTSHVQFEEELDMTAFCQPDVVGAALRYELAAVVIHHGRGFGSGHYTTYCYNREAESWVHCNDARVRLSNMEEVLKSQAYILFYTQKLPTRSSPPVLSHFEQKADEEIVFNFQNSTIPKFVELKRRRSRDDEKEEEELKAPKMKRARSAMF